MLEHNIEPITDEIILEALTQHYAGSLNFAKPPIVERRNFICLKFAHHTTMENIMTGLGNVRNREWVPTTMGILWNPLTSTNVENFTQIVNTLPGRYLRAAFFRERTQMPYKLVELLLQNPELLKLIADRVAQTDAKSPNPTRGYNIIKTSLCRKVLDYPQLPEEYQIEAALTIGAF